MMQVSRFKITLRQLTLLILTAFLVWLFTQIPYDILREERFRAMGENRITVWIVDKKMDTTDGLTRKLLFYRYKDADGITRQSVVSADESTWNATRIGTPLAGFAAKVAPGLSRIIGQEEEPFRLWLRNALGEAAQ
ncbi:MAG: hypothetical protein V3573_05630 [Desulfovibrionaceae bacterium]